MADFVGAQTFRWEGMQDFSNALRQLPEKVQTKVLRSALRSGAVVIRKEAVRRVRKRSGELAKSIVVRTQRGRFDRVLIGFKRPVGSRAHFEEFGTRRQAASPFIRPAFDAKGSAAIEKIGQMLGRGIEREAEKSRRS